MPRLLIIIMFIIFIEPLSHASTSKEYAVKHFPAEPVLVVNNEKELCDEVLESAQDLFSSDASDFDIASITKYRLGTSVQSWSPVFEDMKDVSSSSIGQLVLDLDGNGRRQVVVYRDNIFNWQGDWHYAYVFPSETEFNIAKEKIKSEWSKSPSDSQYPNPNVLNFGARQYYPSSISTDNKAVQTGDVWAEHSLFSWKNKYYFFTGTTEFDRLKTNLVSVFRLHGNGATSEACRIDIRDIDKTYARFKSTPGISSFLKEIRTIGAGGNDCGTLHSGIIHDTQALAAEIRTALRPWAASIKLNSSDNSEQYYKFDDRTRRFLDLWSQDDVWSRREYLVFLQHIDAAEDGMSSYLTNEFGISPANAKVEATEVIDDLIGTRFLIPSEFEMTEESRNLYFGQYSVINAVVMRNKDAFDSYLLLHKPINEDGNSSIDQILSMALSNSVEWPYGLKQLLKAGANPNLSNDFGKTPLMVAAHMDRPDSVRALIGANSDVNASTHTNDDSGSCNEGPSRVGRTALTYAAENASPVVIKLLLDAGANPSIRDSEGNGLDYYLKQNPRLTNEEKSLGIVGVSRIESNFTEPSFSCTLAHADVEKAICNNEVLRIYDYEMSRAYKELYSRLGSSLVFDQKAWLKHRNTECLVNGKQSDDCLAEMIQTRIRYLHNRINEYKNAKLF